MSSDVKDNSRSFMWLNITQFLGALNDNIFQLLIYFFLTFVLSAGTEAQAKILFIVSIAFVLPFLLFSHAAGVLADRYSKRNIVVFAKILEVIVMLSGCGAVYYIIPGGNWALYGLMFLMCTQSAIFGPSKYGIIPELVKKEDLSRANSFLVGLTYLAIILGTFIPSLFLEDLFPDKHIVLAGFCVFVAIAGLLASLRIEKTPPVGKRRPFTPLFIVDIFRTMSRLRGDKELFLAVVGAVYFLFLGGFIKLNILLYGQQHLGLSETESGYLFPVAALGIGIGALLAGKVSGRNIEFGVVPVGAAGLTICCILLAVIPPDLNMARVLVFFVGVCSGLYIVPLNSFVQYRAPKEARGEILACQNFFSFIGVAVAAVLFMLFSNVWHISPSMSFVILGVLTGILALLATIVLPDFLVRFIIVVITRVFYRIKVRGLENLPVDGGALLVSNHVTWVDALLISAVGQRRIRFLMARHIYDGAWVKPIFRLMGVIPVSPKDPPRQVLKSLKQAREELDKGYLVCIFAEGAITRNGNLRDFKPGLERIVKNSNHPVIPVYIGNAWGSIFSYYHGKLLKVFPKKIPYNVSVLFGSALKASSSIWQIRQSVLELSTQSFDIKKNTKDRNLPAMFISTARKRWHKPAIADTTGKKLSFGKTLTAALALAGAVKKQAGKSEMIGVMLPSSAGGALVNIAIALLGRVSVNLNFTASRNSVASAIKQCDITTVISSRAFLEKLEGLEAPEGTVMLEDISSTITGADKLFALIKARFCPAQVLVPRIKDSDAVATIIFSSGSTGEPKGVMLSHHNIISNIESFSQVVRFVPEDRMCGILPFFHSFGYTVTLWCPLITGFFVKYHPNPVDGSKIAEIVREDRLTALLATPTFLLAYIRRAKKEDFKTLRIVVTGAEKLKTKLANTFLERFGICPREGYGTTELAPVASLSVPDVKLDGVKQWGTKEGSIGHPCPGIAMRIVDPDTGKELGKGEEGLLLVKGPNVMLGYLGNEEKTAEVLKDGWYNTGDIARMDKDGFAFIMDRLSRFSKIGGEMVPHIAVEDTLLDALSGIERVLAVTSAPDEKKGERLVVLYTDAAGSAEDLQKIIAESDLPNLWRPRNDSYAMIESMPVLGSGKMDLKELKLLAKEFVDNKPGPGQKILNAVRDAL